LTHTVVVNVYVNVTNLCKSGNEGLTLTVRYVLFRDICSVFYLFVLICIYLIHVFNLLFCILLYYC